VFGWTTQKFPFGVKTAHALKIREPRVITVTGKAFSDVGHSFKDQRLNWRSHVPGDAAFEIHPMMKLTSNNSLSAHSNRGFCQPQDFQYL